jgi:hypothetical protein
MKNPVSIGISTELEVVDESVTLLIYFFMRALKHL